MYLQKIVKLFFEAMECLTIKDLGEVRKFLLMHVILGVEYANTMSQQATIEENLQRSGMLR